MRDISKVTLSLAVATALSLGMSGCGSSDSTPQDDIEQDIKSNLETGVVTGNAIDGYIRNALVCLDVNRNNECNDDEPFSKTTSTGTYSLDISSYTKAQLTQAQLLVMGGVDNDTGTSFQGVLKAPFKESGEVHVTPITSIVAQVLEENNVSNEELNATVEAVAKSLGIDSSKVDSDYVKTQQADASDTDVMKAALQIQKAVEILSQAVATNADKPLDLATADALKGLAKQLQSGNNDISEAIDNYAQTEGNITSSIASAAKDMTTAIESAMQSVATGTDVVKAALSIEESRDKVQEQIKNKVETITAVTTTFSATTMSDNELYLRRLLGLANVEAIDEHIEELTTNITGVTKDTTLEQLLVKVKESGLEEIAKAYLTSQLNTAILNEKVDVTATNSIKAAFENKLSFISIDNIDDSDTMTIKAESTELDANGTMTGDKYYYMSDDEEFVASGNKFEDNEAYVWIDGEWKIEKEKNSFSDDGTKFTFSYGTLDALEIRVLAQTDISNQSVDLIMDADKSYSIEAPADSTQYLLGFKDLIIRYFYNADEPDNHYSDTNLTAYINDRIGNSAMQYECKEESSDGCSYIEEDGLLVQKSDSEESEIIGSWSIVPQSLKAPEHLEVKYDSLDVREEYNSGRWIKGYFIGHDGYVRRGDVSSGLSETTQVAYSTNILPALATTLKSMDEIK